MIAGGECRLATRTTFELNLFVNRMIGADTGIGRGFVGRG